ncbi:MAG: ANTAR domain-containing protein [Myxococcota bacterium]|nr:ANTAR domain-containing protein [Myxococcota bacterium]
MLDLRAMAGKLRVLLVDQREERSSELAQGLESAGCLVVAHSTPSLDLSRTVASCKPDVVIIDVDSPDRDTLEGMRRLDETQPHPIVLFADESDEDSIRRAMRAGVAAYVVKGAQADRVRPVLEVAMARFREHRALVDELAQVKSTLKERKLVDRAKGILMEKRQLSEPDAYALLRKMAMDKSLRLADVARRVIDMAELL